MAYRGLTFTQWWAQHTTGWFNMQSQYYRTIEQHRLAWLRNNCRKCLQLSEFLSYMGRWHYLVPGILWWTVPSRWQEVWGKDSYTSPRARWAWRGQISAATCLVLCVVSSWWNGGGGAFGLLQQVFTLQQAHREQNGIVISLREQDLFY